MSATDSPTATHDSDTTVEHDVHHPTPKQYVQIALILGVLTAMETSTFFIDFAWAHLPLLVGLMAIKFALVAGWFMHLKFDTRLFTRLLMTGLTLALILYAVVLVVTNASPMLEA